MANAICYLHSLMHTYNNCQTYSKNRVKIYILSNFVSTAASYARAEMRVLLNQGPIGILIKNVQRLEAIPRVINQFSI